MPLRLLQFKPGIVKDITEYSAGKNGPYWIDGDNIRFKNGYPTKIGGWEIENLYPLDNTGSADYGGTPRSLDGIARNMVTWRSISSGEDVIAVGTSDHLYIIENEAVYDITPLRKTSSSLSNPITTTSGSSVININDVAHGATDGDWVVIDSASAVNGITADTINAYRGYQLTYVDADNYTIDVGTAATGSGTGGGTLNIAYLVGAAGNLGTTSSAPALGWGAGGWGGGTWGTPRTAGVGTRLENSQWSLNLWGEDLIATVRNGAIYYWDLSGGVGSRAVLVSSLGGATSVPDENRLTSISFPDRHAISAGCTPYGGSDIDPMQVRWSDQEDFKVWAPTATNTAGDQRLEVGTKIIAITPTRDETFISTDEAVYGMTFIGPPFTFSFRLLGTNCGAGGKNVMMNVDGDVFWMGTENFFMYDGAIKEVPCPVRYYVFDRMQADFIDKTFAAHNKKFNEVTWFYVSTANPAGTLNPEPDSFVTYNYRDNAWSIGTMTRTTWSDSFGFKTTPFAIDENGYLYNHEVGTDANGLALSAHVETSPLEIDVQGEALMLIDKIIPDITMTGDLDITVETKKYPNGTATTKGPFTISQNSTKVSMRARARQMTMKLESTNTGDSWSLGDFRVNARQDGLR
jgi:hypothetical protein